jgi:hypothetical protein
VLPRNKNLWQRLLRFKFEHTQRDLRFVLRKSATQPVLFQQPNRREWHLLFPGTDQL